MENKKATHRKESQKTYCCDVAVLINALLCHLQAILYSLHVSSCVSITSRIAQNQNIARKTGNGNIYILRKKPHQISLKASHTLRRMFFKLIDTELYRKSVMQTLFFLHLCLCIFTVNWLRVTRPVHCKWKSRFMLWRRKQNIIWQSNEREKKM